MRVPGAPLSTTVGLEAPKAAVERMRYRRMGAKNNPIQRRPMRNGVPRGLWDSGKSARVLAGLCPFDYVAKPLSAG
jgi:hypothetical protein